MCIRDSLFASCDTAQKTQEDSAQVRWVDTVSYTHLPGLIFGTLPQIFHELTGGAVFAILFFVLVFFAAITSAIALLETVVSYVIEKWNIPRTRAVLGTAGLIFLVGIPSSLSFGSLSDMTLWGYTFFDLAGMLTDNLLLPLGGLLMCYFIGWRWKPEILADEIEEGGVRFRWRKAWIIAIRFITPILISIVMVTGFISIYQTIAG